MFVTKIRTKSSLRVLVEGEGCHKLSNAAKELTIIGYELRVVEDNFFAAIEVFLELNIALQERSYQAKEILEVIDKHLYV